MTERTAGGALAEPPEGVIAGDSVPRENDADDIEQQFIDEMVGLLKTHQAYVGKSDAELREIAKEKLA